MLEILLPQSCQNPNAILNSDSSQHFLAEHNNLQEVSPSALEASSAVLPAIARLVRHISKPGVKPERQLQEATLLNFLRAGLVLIEKQAGKVRSKIISK